MKEAVDDIMVTLNEAASEVGMVGGMVESIAEAMAKVSAAGQIPVIRTYRTMAISFSLCPKTVIGQIETEEQLQTIISSGSLLPMNSSER